MSARCAYSPSGCNVPEGECPGLCLHRVNTATMTRPVVAIKGRVEELPIQFAEPDPISPARLALNTWRLYRGCGCGLRESFRNAWRAYRRAN